MKNYWAYVRQNWWTNFRIFLATTPIGWWLSGVFLGAFFGPSSMQTWSLQNLGVAVLITSWWAVSLLIFRKLARRSLKKQGISHDTNTR